MVVERGQIWWADLGEPRGSIPGYHRPVLIVQANSYNLSRITTVIAIALSTNLSLGNMPGNVRIGTLDSGLPKDSVANVSQFITLNKADLLNLVGVLAFERMLEVDQSLRRVLAL